MSKSEILGEAVASPKALLAGVGVASHVVAEWICARVPALCAYIAWLPDQLVVLLAMMGLDMVTGVLASRYEGHRIVSKRWGVGVYKKVGMLLVVAAAFLLDRVLPTYGLVYVGAVFWFIGQEFLSLYENAERMQVPMPAFLKAAAEKALQRADASATAALSSQKEVR